MAHLTDMEELVSSVQGPDIRDYMSESLSCYMAGAYRASVVLTFIALFDDILAKLGELGKVNKKARAIHQEASKRRADQDVYETYLIDQLKASALLTSLDAGFLETLRNLRNKAAHPSGHHASAEEARFVFFEAITRFLSRPILSTTQLADQILASLGNANVFPSNMIDDTTKVVKNELKNVHPQVFPYLVSKLIEKSREADKDVSRNSRFFLNGLARMGDIDALAALKKHAIEQLASSKSDSITVLALLCANGKLFADLDEVTYKRLAVLVGERIDSVAASVSHTTFSHPASVFVNLFSANKSEVVLDKLGAEYGEFIERFPYSAYFTKFVLSHEVPRKLLLNKLYEKAGSNDFHTANGFVKYAGDLETIAGSDLQDEEAFRLLVNVMKAADTGAYDAIDMRNANFGVVPVLREKALQFRVGEPAAAASIAKAVLGEDEVEESLKWLVPDAGP